MTARTLRAVSRTQGCNVALKDGSVQPRGYTLDFEEVPVLVKAFRRMVREHAYDVCEMAFTTYLCARAHGRQFTALPIFLVRGMHHGAIVRSARSPLTSPRELEGQRVGVNRGYTVTTGVWARAILEEEHGVDLDRVTWVPTGDEHVTEYVPPSNVSPLPEDGDLSRLVADGDVAAGIGITADSPDLAPLLPDAEEAGFRAFQERGFYPINHLVVVRDELLDEDPELGPAIFDAFAEAKRRQVARLKAGDTLEPTAADHIHRRVMALSGADPLPYGVEPNRDMIEQLLDHAVRQRILSERPSVAELFAQGTLDITG